MCDAPKINQMLLRKIFAQFQLKYFCLKQVDRIATRGRRGAKKRMFCKSFFSVSLMKVTRVERQKEVKNAFYENSHKYYKALDENCYEAQKEIFHQRA